MSAQSAEFAGGTSATLPERGTWDTIATDYEDLAEPFTRQYAEAALRLAGGVEPGATVLDVAAGTGSFTLVAARAGARVLGTDFAPGMVARLAARLREGGFDGSEARVLDGQALSLADASFDAAFSMFGVTLFPDWQRGLAELARVVRPGGRGVVGVWADPAGAGPTPVFHATYRRVFPDTPIPPAPPGMVRLTDPTAFQVEMEAAGFHSVTVHTVGGVFRAPSAAWIDANRDRLFRYSPLYSALNPEDRTRLGDALRTAWSAHTTPTGIEVPSEAHIAIGHR